MLTSVRHVIVTIWSAPTLVRPQPHSPQWLMERALQAGLNRSLSRFSVTVRLDLLLHVTEPQFPVSVKMDFCWEKKKKGNLILNKQNLKRTDYKSLVCLGNYKNCLVEFPERLFHCPLIFRNSKKESKAMYFHPGHRNYSINKILELVLSI